jgi:hypothetical protein
MEIGGQKSEDGRRFHWFSQKEIDRRGAADTMPEDVPSVARVSIRFSVVRQKYI